MAIELEIKTQSNYKEKLNLQEIISENILIGKKDNFDRIIIINDFKICEGEVIFFEEKCMGRGVLINFEENRIYMRLSVPTVRKEIDLFYNIAYKIEAQLNTADYSSDAKYNQIEMGYKDNNKALYEAMDLAKNKFKYIELSCITNPIYIGEKDVDVINNNIENFEMFLQSRQQNYYYYAILQLMKKKEVDEVIGFFSLPPDQWSIIPYRIDTKYNNKIVAPEDIYVFLGQTKDDIIPYKDLINNLEAKVECLYYDYKNVLAKVSSEKAKELIDKYKVDIEKISKA